jgi:hypothetical protein
MQGIWKADHLADVFAITCYCLVAPQGSLLCHFGVPDETSTVLRAVVADFVFNCLCMEILLDNCIRHIPRCIHYHVQSFRLEVFQDFYAGSGSCTQESYSVSPDWFKYCFIYEKFVACREF